MYCTLMPSLEHIALVKISIILWNQDDITAQLGFPYRNSKSTRPKKWQEVENKVKEKVAQFSLPELLKTKILNFIKPIGLEIITWRQYHEKCLCLIAFDGKSLNRFHWTPQGTVDEKKTAEAFIKDGDLDIVTRYTLACLYCLETDIPELWDKISKNRRKLFYDKSPFKVRQKALVIFWTYYIKGEVAKVDNMNERRLQHRLGSYQYLFEYAAYDCNKAATEYFLQKLTPRERAESLLRYSEEIAGRYHSFHSKTCSIPNKYCADVLRFLLSQMDKEQQTVVLRNCRYEVLDCVLNWPWQNFFMETAGITLDFLSEVDCYNTLRNIADRVIEGLNDFGYESFFGEFWQRVPRVYKGYVVNRFINSFMLPKLLEIRDEKIVRLILKDASVIEEMEFIFSGVGHRICEDLIYDDNWNLLKIFIGECISTRDELMNIKEKFKDCKIRYYPTKEFPTKKDKWDKFFQLLNDLIYRYNKRKCVDKGHSNRAKILRSTE